MRPLLRTLKLFPFLFITLLLINYLWSLLSRHNVLDPLLPDQQHMPDMVRRPPYNNTCLGLTSQHTPDPYFTYAHGKFYLTFTGNDRVPMWEASNLMDFWREAGSGSGSGSGEEGGGGDGSGKGYVRGPVWIPPPDSKHSARLWAPELHSLRGRWYIYYAAMDPALGNRSHRMYVLGGPAASEDPHAGPWEFLGPIKGMDQRQWAIDGTVFEIDEHLYFTYSGWPLDRPRDDYDEKTQQLFILRLSDPTTASSQPVAIAKPEHVWERTGPVGIIEGPQWLASPFPHNKWQGLVYSCGASWTKEYKMATLKYLGPDPLSPDSWLKSRDPLIQNSDTGKGPFGPGHGSFLHFGNETVALFHATDRDTDGNQGRKCRMQRVLWTSEGPWMGGVVGPFTRDLTRFLGGSQSGSLERALRGGGSG